MVFYSLSKKGAFYRNVHIPVNMSIYNNLAFSYIFARKLWTLKIPAGLPVHKYEIHLISAINIKTAIPTGGIAVLTFQRFSCLVCAKTSKALRSLGICASKTASKHS